MKQPKNRYFKLPKKYKVLDIGGGDHPHPRANVVVEKNPADNTHRKWDMRLLKHQEVVIFVTWSLEDDRHWRA
ncbi:MAG: hypothetical protein ACPG5D_00580 [Schleiferiaceae bacterium]